MSKFPEDLMYAETHEWIKKDGDLFLVGISDYAQEQLGDIVYVDFPEIGKVINIGEQCGELESSKAVSEINMPFKGTIVEVNTELEETPELINESPYDAWIIKIRAENSSDYNNLLNSREAQKVIEGDE